MKNERQESWVGTSNPSSWLRRSRILPFVVFLGATSSCIAERKILSVNKPVRKHKPTKEAFLNKHKPDISINFHAVNTSLVWIFHPFDDCDGLSMDTGENSNPGSELLSIRPFYVALHEQNEMKTLWKWSLSRQVLRFIIPLQS